MVCFCGSIPYLGLAVPAVRRATSNAKLVGVGRGCQLAGARAPRTSARPVVCGHLGRPVRDGGHSAPSLGESVLYAAAVRRLARAHVGVHRETFFADLVASVTGTNLARLADRARASAPNWLSQNGPDDHVCDLVSFMLRATDADSLFGRFRSVRTRQFDSKHWEC